MSCPQQVRMENDGARTWQVERVVLNGANRKRKRGKDMKAMKKALALGLALAMVVTAVPVTNAQAATTGLPKSKNYYAGKTYTLKLTTPSSWKSVKTTWSEKSSAVSLSSKKAKSVKVKAIKKGSATVKATVTYKKSSKSYKKTYSCKVTVKNSSITAPATAEVVEGATVSVKATAKPASAKVTYVSDNVEVATVDAAGVVTGVKAGTAKITATATCGTVKKTAETTVTVKAAVAQLTEVKQTASNAFVATFSADASKTITKDDIKIAAADGTVELAVKSVEYSADGLSAKVTVFGNFTNTTAYKVTCKDATLDFTAKVGEVARIAIDTASAEKDVETAIVFALFDADGIDVTPSVSLDTTCFVTVTGNYSAANLDKASKASITMNVIGDKADVTVTYNSNAVNAQDVTATQTVICVDNKAVQGGKLFADLSVPGRGGKYKNTVSGCAKFYLGLSDSTVSVAENGSTSELYFCAKDSKGSVISYDAYEVESSNDDVASASLDPTADSGKYAKITVNGNIAGSAVLNVKATKNGKDTYYTIPVVVTKHDEAVRMTVSVTKPTMSNVDDQDYYGEVCATLYDKNGKEVPGTFHSEPTTTVTSGRAISVNDNGDGRHWWNGSVAKIDARTAVAKTYTIKVTGADANTGKTFERNVNVVVKALPTGKLKLTYQIELNRTVVDENPIDTGDDSVKAKLYATYNGLFAGYVRSDSGAIEIAEGHVIPAEDLTDVQVAAKLGTSVYKAGALYSEDAATGFHTIGSTADTTFTAVNSTAGNDTIKWTPLGSADLAKTGMYTIEYRLYTSDTKYTSRTQTFNVKNSVAIPTVTVTSRTVDSLSDPADIIKVLSTNVDMNNNDSEHESIMNLYADTNTTAPTASSTNKMTVKYATVKDAYTYNVNNVDTVDTWVFYVPINSTFKTE